MSTFGKTFYFKKQFYFVIALSLWSYQIFIKNQRKKRRLLRTLENYFIRFCTRPSTFFTFGYVGVGEFSRGAIEENLKCEPKSIEKIVDLSTEWILKFLKLILKDREVLKEAFVFSNPNLVEIGEKLLNQKLHFNQLNISKIVLTDLTK